jgi:hypothetical protein
MEIPSPKGASLAGDEYQHAYTLVRAMELLKEDRGVVGIGMEVREAGNVDDLVVRRVERPDSYHQIKFVMTQSELLTYGWFMETTPKGKSILQRFYDSFVELTEDGLRPELELITNRGRDGTDPLLPHTDGRDAKLMPRLAEVGPQSAAGKALGEWAAHLGISREGLDEMLGHLSIRSDLASLTTIKDLCRLSLESCGYRGGPDAVLACIGAIRELVIAGEGRRADVGRERWQQIMDGLGLALGEPSASLVVQSIAAHPAAGEATAALDWLNLYEPGARRLKDDSWWMERLWPELQAAADAVRASGRKQVALMGSLRLSTGFAVGTLLPARAGVELVHVAYNESWSTIGDTVAFDIAADEHDIGQGEQLAVGLSTTGDLREEVIAFIRDQGMPVKTFVNITPPGGPGPLALPDPAQARGWAQAAMRAIRKASLDAEQPLHLFQYGPLFGGMLLGSVWNRMPATQLYDDTPPGYTPTFMIEAS